MAICHHLNHVDLSALYLSLDIGGSYDYDGQLAIKSVVCLDHVSHIEASILHFAFCLKTLNQLICCVIPFTLYLKNKCIFHLPGCRF